MAKIRCQNLIVSSNQAFENLNISQHALRFLQLAHSYMIFLETQADFLSPVCDYMFINVLSGDVMFL